VVDLSQVSFDLAKRTLKLTPQEENVYRHHLGNLWRGGVPMQGGGIASFRSITVGVDGKTYVIPTVWYNQIVSNDEALKHAHALGMNNWPAYDSEEEAERRYQEMHRYMDADTKRQSARGYTPR
jgi:hypothetical protein